MDYKILRDNEEIDVADLFNYARNVNYWTSPCWAAVAVIDDTLVTIEYGNFEDVFFTVANNSDGWPIRYLTLDEYLGYHLGLKKSSVRQAILVFESPCHPNYIEYKREFYKLADVDYQRITVNFDGESSLCWKENLLEKHLPAYAWSESASWLEWKIEAMFAHSFVCVDRGADIRYIISEIEDFRAENAEMCKKRFFSLPDNFERDWPHTGLVWGPERKEGECREEVDKA